MLYCDICGQQELSEADLKTHLLLSHMEREISCPLCCLSGVTYDQMTLHVDTAHFEAEGEWSNGGEHIGKRFNSNPETLSYERDPESSETTTDMKKNIPKTCSAATEKEVCDTHLQLAHSPDLFDDQRPHSEDETYSAKTIAHPINLAEEKQHEDRVPPLADNQVDHDLLQCPFCSNEENTFQGLELHVQTQHAELLKTPKKGNDMQQHECPFCQLVCSSSQILQEHVDLHLLEESHLTHGLDVGGSSKDFTLANQLQEEENRQRRCEESRHEQQHFKKLQQQYGLDNSGGYKKQSLQNMERAVARGRMQPYEFHVKKAEMMESLAIGVDSGRTKTSEMQVPCITKIQSMIESAWKEGFDPQGASQFNNKLNGTKAWIGACEIYSLLTFLNLKCCIVDFHKPTGPAGTHPLLFQWVLNYFSSDGDCQKVICTSKSPIYLQHQGHSRTIVGIEEKKNGAHCLLVFDPGCPSQDMQKLLKQDINGSHLKMLRRFPGSLKHKQYQIVAVEGVLKPQEKAARRQASKVFAAERIP
ncbi:zinc finger-containing ubiquitin peptidase 1 isoform X2 [Pleurodeles waltl]|uniref:zinc finger-containing ubiquitin peptidase 1 isoform X2 n=1 Tax=Pleurodeles waltl TaxID=8319 RepID=UPI003709AE5F